MNKLSVNKGFRNSVFILILLLVTFISVVLFSVCKITTIHAHSNGKNKINVLNPQFADDLPTQNRRKIINPLSSPCPQKKLPPAEEKQGKKLGYYNYKYSFHFGGYGLGGGYFDRPIAIDIDSEDNIYIVDQGNNLVQKFDRYGGFLCEWECIFPSTSSADFDRPSAIAIDTNDNVYMINIDGHSVRIIANDSCFNFFGNFRQSIDFVIDDSNNVYVLDSEAYKIKKYRLNLISNEIPMEELAKKAKFIKETEWGMFGSCRECFLAPSRIAYDQSGFNSYIYVLDHKDEGFLLHKIDKDGNFFDTLDIFHNTECPIIKPFDIYIDEDGYIYVIDQKTSSICKFNTDGEFIQKISDPSSEEATLKKPQALVQDSNKRLLIVDSGDNLVKIFDQF